MQIKVKDDQERQKAEQYIKGYYDGITTMLNQLINMKEQGKSTKYLYKVIKKNAAEYDQLIRKVSTLDKEKDRSK